MSMDMPNANTPWYLVTEISHYLHGKLCLPGEKVQYVGEPGKFLVLLDGPNGNPAPKSDGTPVVVPDEAIKPAHETSDPRARRRAAAPEAVPPPEADAPTGAAAPLGDKSHRRDPRGAPAAGAPGTF